MSVLNSSPTATSSRPQVRPAVEGAEPAVTSDGRPLLQFKSPRVKQPPTHLADLTLAERQAKLKEMGLPAFRAKQLSTHYFSRLVDDPSQMTDLPSGDRAAIVETLLPELMTPLRTLEADKGTTRMFTRMDANGDGVLHDDERPAPDGRDGDEQESVDQAHGRQFYL